MSETEDNREASESAGSGLNTSTSQVAPGGDPALSGASEPAPPSVNPFAGSSETTTGEPRMPQCFDSVSDQLPPQVRSKLRTVDVSTAQVVLVNMRGRKSEPIPLTWFVEDFGEEAAQLIGMRGLVRVAVYEPNKAPWYFGVKVGGREGGENSEADELRAMIREMADQQQKFMETVRMEMVLGGGNAAPAQGADSFERELQRTRALIGCLREMQGGNDPAELVSKTFEGMGKAMDGMNAFREKAGSIVEAREPDPIDQFNRFTENPVVQQGIQGVFSKVLGNRSDAGKTGATPQPAEPTVNPFKTGAA